MAVSLLGKEGWGTRVGRFLSGINVVNNYRKDDIDDYVSLVLSGYQETTQIAVDNLISQRDQYRGVHASWLQQLQTMASTTTVQQVNDDTPLTSVTLEGALTELATQFRENSQTFKRPTTSATVTASNDNYGNGIIVASLLDPTGLTLDMVIPETLTATVTNDAGGSATAYAEPIRIQGLPSVDGLSYDWPQGSGANASLSFVDGTSTTGNLVNNGGFDTWTSAASAPSSWTIGTGTANTTVVRSSDNYRGTYSCQFAGNGSELTAIYQAPSQALLPNTVYVVSAFMKRSAGAAAGVIRMRLADGTGATITNDQSVANAVSTTVSSGLTTSYSHVYGFFQTPRVLPTTVRLYIDLTTAITNGQTVNIDVVALTPGVELYDGGPFVSAFSADTQSATNDAYDIAVTSNQGINSFVPGLDRIFALRSLGIRFPTTAGTPTVPDSLITG